MRGCCDRATHDLLLRRARGGAAGQLPRVHRAALSRRPRSTASRERRVGGVHQVPRVRARGALRRLRRRSSPRGAGRRGHRGPSAVERTRDGDDAVLLGRQRPVPAGAARGRCEGLPPLARRLRRRRSRGGWFRSPIPGRVSTWRQPSRSCGGCGRRGSPVCTCRARCTTRRCRRTTTHTSIRSGRRARRWVSCSCSTPPSGPSRAGCSTCFAARVA